MPYVFCLLPNVEGFISGVAFERHADHTNESPISVSVETVGADLAATLGAIPGYVLADTKELPADAVAQATAALTPIPDAASAAASSDYVKGLEGALEARRAQLETAERDLAAAQAEVANLSGGLENSRRDVEAALGESTAAVAAGREALLKVASAAGVKLAGAKTPDDMAALIVAALATKTAGEAPTPPAADAKPPKAKASAAATPPADAPPPAPDAPPRAEGDEEPF